MDKQDAIFDDAGFHGIFQGLRKLEVIDNITDDIYAGDFAKFWPQYAGSSVDDIPVYSRLLHTHQERVLDLACGDGRIGLALARIGCSVDGLELSGDMLAQCASRLKHEADEVRDRMAFFQGNMCNFSLPHTYDLIILGVTSISLLLQAEQRLALLRMVQRHLKPDGKFIFDILDFSGERWKKHDHVMDVLSREDSEGQEFAIVGQRLDQERKQFTLNVYREAIAWNGDTRRSLGSSTKAWIEVAELHPASAQAGLVIVDEFREAGSHYFVLSKA